MKKLFFVLYMSALIFTGCSKFSPGAGGQNYTGPTSKQIFKSFCDTYPQKRPCPDIANNTEISLQEVKPVMKVTEDSSEILYGAADPVAWDQGFSNVDSTKGAMLNFSTEDESIIPVGTAIWIFEVSTDLAGPISRPNLTVTATVGGDEGSAAYDAAYKGSTMVRLAVFKDLGKYMYLPRIHLLP